VTEEFSGGWVDDADVEVVEVVDEHDDVGSGVGSADADVVERSCVTRGRRFKSAQPDDTPGVWRSETPNVEVLNAKALRRRLF
jgi:hypothetical protein